MQLTLNISHTFDTFEALAKFTASFEKFCDQAGVSFNARPVPHQAVVPAAPVQVPVNIPAPPPIVEPAPVQADTTSRPSAPENTPSAKGDAPARGRGRPKKDKPATAPALPLETAQPTGWGAAPAAPAPASTLPPITAPQAGAITSDFISVCGVEKFAEILRAIGFQKPGDLPVEGQAKFCKILETVTKIEKSKGSWAVQNVIDLWNTEVGSDLWKQLIGA